jgi:hypothetical protein
MLDAVGSLGSSTVADDVSEQTDEASEPPSPHISLHPDPRSHRKDTSESEPSQADTSIGEESGASKDSYLGDGSHSGWPGGETPHAVDVSERFTHIPFEVFYVASGQIDDDGVFRLEPEPEQVIELFCEAALLESALPGELAREPHDRVNNLRPMEVPLPEDPFDDPHVPLPEENDFSQLVAEERKLLAVTRRAVDEAQKRVNLLTGQGAQNLDRTDHKNSYRIARYEEALVALENARTAYREHRTSHWETLRAYRQEYRRPASEEDEQRQVALFTAVLTARRIQKERRR